MMIMELLLTCMCVRFEVSEVRLDRLQGIAAKRMETIRLGFHSSVVQ
jgi:hypothetical protein